MEVGLHQQRADNHNHIVHNHNMNNGQGPAKGRGHKHHSHGKAKTLPTSGHEFRSPDRGVQEDNNNRLKVPKDEEMRQQTKKVMEAFFQSIVAKNGVAERIRKESRERFERENDIEDDRVSTSGSMQHYRSVKPTRVPLRQESDEEKLRKIMSGQMSRPMRHQSDISLVSSDSADSSAQKGGFHRTKSFTKAQRHSILSDLENRTKKQAVSRRSSEVVPQTPSLYLEESLPDDSAFETVKQTSPISHSRASSDPVVAKYDTTGRFKSQNKEATKKSRFWIKFKKKKHGQKLKDDSRDSATSGEAAAATYAGHGAKVTKSHSDRRAITREDSTTSRRRSPSPPGIIKRFSSRKKKNSGKTESSLSQSVFSKNASRSRSFDDIDGDTLETANGDAKSNSLPMEVSLSTKPHNHHHGHKKHESKHKENWHHSSAVATDGVSDHPSKSGKKGRRDSYEVQRPNTLELPKKKSSNWKKFKKILFDSSSSSSSSSSGSSYSSAEDLNEAIRGVLDRELRESEVSGQAQRSSRNIKHSHSDNQPSVNNVRGRYQHRSSLSMSDMDRQNKNISEIAKKLRRVAEGYGHIIAQQYAGPTGRTHTPDSYWQDMQRLSHRGREAPVTRSSSQTAPSGRVPSASMKAYYNMAAASRTPSTSETGGRRPRQRITRAEVFHRPSGSFDSPHREPVTTDSWSDRIETERSPRSQIHVIHHDQRRREESPLLRRSDNASHPPPHPSDSPASQHRFKSPPMSRQSPPPHHHRHSADSHSARNSRGSPRTQPPPPTKSESPNLRSSRLGRFPAGSQSSALPNTVATDHHPHHHNVHYERHLDRTITARSPRLTRTVHTHRDIVGDMVEADALPSVLADGDSTDVDMAMAFGDDDDITDVTERRTETITMTEEIDGAPSLAATGGRQRSATSPSRIPATRFDDDDDLDANDDELGAVGGADPEEIDEDKLVEKLVEALCKKGDQYKDELETPQLEKGITKLLTKLSKDKVKEVVGRALAKINEQTAAFRHPEIIELALIFNMADLFGRITTRATYLTGLLDSFIEPIVKRFGGWGSMLQNSLDETEREIIDLDLDKDVPSTSGQKRHDKHRRDSDVSDPELD